MNCNEMHSKMADLLFDADAIRETEQLNAEESSEVNAETAAHLERCHACRDQLAELRATMALMDTWEAPEPNPYFLTRLNARLEEERRAEPAGWFERLRTRLVSRVMYGGSRVGLRPVAAMTLTIAVLVGGGTYLEFDNPEQQAPPPQAAVVHDLQTLDSNAQLLDQLESLSGPPDQNNDD